MLKAGSTSHAPDEVCLQGLKVKCIVGVLPAEREHAQDVTCKIELALHTRPVAEKANLQLGVDYREVVERVRFLLEHGRFFLLETAAETVAMDLLRHAPNTAQVAVTLEKPEVFTEDVVPSLRVVRRREDLQEKQKQLFEGVTQSCVFSHRHGGLFSLELAPHKAISLSVAGESPLFLLEYGALFFGDDEVLSLGSCIVFEKEQILSFTSGENGARFTCLALPVVEAGGTQSFLRKDQIEEALNAPEYVHLSSRNLSLKGDA